MMMDYTLMDELKAKLNLTTMSKPALAGIAVVFVVVAVLVGRMFLGTASASDLVVEPKETTEVTESVEAPTPTTVFVHVSGAVQRPGLVEVSDGARVADAIQAAGGLTEDADGASVNLARVVADGEQVVVATLASQTMPMEGTTTAGASSATPSTAPASGKININTASAEELTALPGVGESTANKIIADRKANGPFASPSDLTRVSGIGDKKLEAMIDLITV